MLFSGMWLTFFKLVYKKDANLVFLLLAHINMCIRLSNVGFSIFNINVWDFDVC